MLTAKEKQDLKKTISSNTHEVYVISFEEMDAIIRSSPNGKKASVQAAWQQVKDHVELGANYHYHAKDAVTMAKLIDDLGAVGTKAYIKTYGGKPHIILKGHPGLRKILTGTKYGITNPKVVSMGLGKASAVSAASRGGILTVVLLSVYRVVDFFLTDQATLSQLIGTLATDVVKVAIATGGAIVIATVAGAATFAIGPIVAVVIIGIGLTSVLEYIDNRLGITKRIIAGLDEIGRNGQLYIDQRKNDVLDSIQKSIDEVIDYAVDSARAIAVDWVRKTAREYLSAYPRVN